MTHTNKVNRLLIFLAIFIALIGSLTSFRVAHSTCVRVESSNQRIYDTLNKSLQQLESIKNGTADPNTAGYDYYKSHPKELDKAIQRSKMERDNYAPKSCNLLP